MATISMLPREVLLYIFSLMPFDLINVGRTCKLWHGLSQDDILLQKITRRHFKEESWSDAKRDFSGGNFFMSKIYTCVYPTREEICLAVYLGIMSLKIRIS